MVVAPHPDDETLGCSRAIALPPNYPLTGHEIHDSFLEFMSGQIRHL
jgi:hypothetical protein